jgi:sulfonate transport system permease protein
MTATVTATATSTSSSTTTRTLSIEAAPRRDDPVIASARKKRLGRSLSILAPIALLTFWQIGSSSGFIDFRVFSSPRETAETGWNLIKDGSLWHNLRATIRRIMVGYVSGSVAGILLGTILGTSALARSAIRPILAALQTVPMLGLYPVFLLIFGLGETPKYLVTFWGMTVLMSLGTTDAVANVPTSYLEAARSMRTSRFHMFTQVIMPAALGRIFTSLRIGIGLGVLSVIGVEILLGNEGIGRLIWVSWNNFLPPDMFVGIIVAALLGVCLNALIGLLQRFAMPWQRDGDRIVA